MSDRPRKRKASKAQMLLRLTELWRIRLDGASVLDAAEYIAEKEQEQGSPWFLQPGDKPLSRRSIEAYLQRVDAMITASTRESRKRSLVKHLARREHLFAKAVNSGDLRTALAVADSEARLRRLFDTPAASKAAVTPFDGPADVTRLVASALAELLAGRMDRATAGTIGTLAAGLLRGMEMGELQKDLDGLRAEVETLRNK